MPMSWAARDALGQFNVLVARKGQLEISETSIRPTARSSDLTSLTPAGVGNPQALSASDVRTSIRSLQQFLLSVVREDELSESCAHLMTLAKQYESIDHNKIERVVDGKPVPVAPSTTDKKETIDDKTDESVTFLVLDTICQLLSSVMGVDRPADTHTPLFRLDQRAAVAEAASSSSTSSPHHAAAGPVVPVGVRVVGLQQCSALIPFAFAYLTHVYSPAVRHVAARLLGLLSVTFLGAITSLFMEKFAAAKKDQAKREFATFQRAVGFLDFRVDTPANVKTTLDYINSIVGEMKNIDRGVLRQEVCQSLGSIYTKLLSPHTPDAPRREAEWATFVRGERGVEDWHVAYERVYAGVAKWSSKSKHAVFCFDLLSRMAVCSRNVEFFKSPKRFDVVTELVKGIKKETGEVRVAFMQILARNYLANVPPAFLQAQQTEFLTSLRALYPALLPKKTKPLPDEIPAMLELLTAAGAKNISLFVNEVAIEMLRPQSSYYSRQKALLLQALSQILEENRSARTEMAQYYLQMGPLVSFYIEDSATNPHLDGAASSTGAGEDDKQLLLLRAALKCFPYVRHPKMEHVQVTAAAVIMLCKHDDREISGSVAHVLQNFIRLDLNQFFLPTLHTLVDLLKLDPDIDQRPDQILKICNTIALLCNMLAEHMQKQDAGEVDSPAAASPSSASGSAPSSPVPLQQFEVTPSAWISLREHLEAVVLMRMCHYEGWVRVELLRMLRNFSRPCFRAFESPAASSALSPNARKEVADVPFLIDYLLPGASKSTSVILPTPEVFFRPLHDLLVKPASADAFRGVLSYAFSFLHKSFGQLRAAVDPSRAHPAELVHQEWYLFFRNKLLFACLAVRGTNQLGESVEGVTPRPQVKGAPTGTGGLLSAQDLALKFTNARPRLAQYQAKVHEVYTFYENIIVFMQTPPSAQTGQTVAAQLAYNSAPATAGLYLVKHNIAKDLSQIRPGTIVATSASPQVFLSNYVELAKHLRKPLSDAEALALQAASNPAQSKKKKGPDVRALFFFNEHTCHVMAKLFTHLTPDEYHTEPSLLTRCLDDYVAMWISLHESNSLESLSLLPVRTRLHTATLASRFLAFRNFNPGQQHASHMSQFEVTRRRGFFFQLLTHLMPTPAENAAVHAQVLDKDAIESVRALESAVLQGVAQLLMLDPLQDQALEGQILYFIESIIVLHQRTHVAAHLHAGLSHALNTFLAMNPKYVHEFVRMSMSETHAHLEAAEADAVAQQQQAAVVSAAHAAAAAKAAAKAQKKPRSRRGSVILSKDERHLIHREAHPSFRPVSLVIARYYLRACATNWTQDFKLWSTLHGFTRPQMLCIALLAHTSSDPESRAIGLLLAAELEKEENAQTKPLRLYSHESPFMYIESALAYSATLAVHESYRPYLLPLLAEAVVLCEYVSTAKKECLIRLLLPWVYEVPTYLLTVEEQQASESSMTAARSVKDVVGEVMMHLTDFTRLAYKASILTDPLKQLWVTLLSNEAVTEKIAQLVSHQVIDEYYALIEAADLQDQQQIERNMVAAPGATPTRPARPSIKTVALPTTPSPTNLANLTGVVTGAVGTPIEPIEEPTADNGPQALVGSQPPVSLAVETQADSEPTVCPSPVQSGEEIEGEEGEQRPPSPSPDVSPLGMEAVHPGFQSAVPSRRLSSVNAALDAGGAARVRATVPLTSPSNAAQVAESRPPLAERNLPKEKALRKFVLMQLLRSPAAEEILATLVAELRTYEDRCPLDPDAFIKFAESRLPSGGAGVEPAEPLTIVERAVFELLSNAVFENRAAPVRGARGAPPDAEDAEEGDRLRAAYPLLLQNAYVLHHATPAGREMLVHLALALGLYDDAHPERDTIIASDRLIPLIVRSYPQIRHAWSRIALAWACNALDATVGESSFHLWQQLESSSFFFGERTQENLVQSVLMLFQNLRRGEETNLKAIVSTLIAPTAFSYDKTGWTALVSCGWALLVMSAVPQFSLGLSLLQCMFSLPDIPSEEQRKWILSLGRFLCRDSGQEVDTAIVDVLFKGLLSAATFQPTLILLQSMADIYAGATLPADNKLVVLLQLVNVMHRMVDLQRVGELYRSHASVVGDAADAAAAKDATSVLAAVPTTFTSIDAESEKSLVRGVDDCVNLSLLMHQYSVSEAAGQHDLARLANLFKNVALSLSRLLPDASNGDAAVAAEDGSASSASRPTDRASTLANWNRQLLFKKMQSMVQVEQDSESKEAEAAADSSPYSNAHSPRAASESLDGVRMPSPSQLASQFFVSFARFFSSTSNFAFGLVFFQRMLLVCPHEWRTPLLVMLGHFLLESSHFPDSKQFQLLAEIVTQAFFTAAAAGRHEEAKLAEQTSYLLIEKRPPGCNLARNTDIFNFVRPRAVPKKVTPPAAAGAAGSAPSVSVPVLVTDGHYDPQGELSESLARIEAHTFPILRQMLNNPRPIIRPMDDASARAARQSHARSASFSALAQMRGSSVVASAGPQPKRLSFATLNEHTADALVAQGATLPLPPVDEAEPSPSPPPVLARPNFSVEAHIQSAPAAVAPAPPVSSPSTNPFASEDPPQGEVEEASRSASASVSVGESRTSAVYDEPAAVPVPVPADPQSSLRRRDDSDSEDDEAIFKAATRRLSNSSKPTSRRPSDSSNINPRRLSEDAYEESA